MPYKIVKLYSLAESKLYPALIICFKSDKANGNFAKQKLP